MFGGFERRGIVVTHLLTMLLVTGLIGLFPAVGIVAYKYLRHLRRYAQPPQPAPLTPTERAADERRVLELVAENGKDRLTLPLADLLYLESADNYSEIVFEQVKIRNKMQCLSQSCAYAREVLPLKLCTLVPVQQHGRRKDLLCRFVMQHIDPKILLHTNS